MAPTIACPRLSIVASRSTRFLPHRTFSSRSRLHAEEGASPFSPVTATTTHIEPDAFPQALPREYQQRRNAPPPSSSRQQQHQHLASTMTRHMSPNATSLRQSRESIELEQRRRALESFQARRWRPGDVYAPHDLSPTEMRKLKRPGPPPSDPFKLLGLNPLDCYKNYSMMAEFCTPMMRIKSRFETGLSNVNQRKYAKAVRRAVGLGLMPSVHKHPEVVENERKWINRRLQAQGYMRA